jgi:hypothetical protein
MAAEFYSESGGTWSCPRKSPQQQHHSLSPAINKGVFCTLWGNTFSYDLNFLRSSCAKYTLKGYAWHALLWPVPETRKKRFSMSICDVKPSTNYVFTSWPADFNCIVERTSQCTKLLKKSKNMTLCIWAWASVFSPEYKDLYWVSN